MSVQRFLLARSFSFIILHNVCGGLSCYLAYLPDDGEVDELTLEITFNTCCLLYIFHHLLDEWCQDEEEE